MSLRDYQQAAVDSTLNWLRYKGTPAIVVIPTGGGKSWCIKALLERFQDEGKRALLLAHRKELLTQTGNLLACPFGYYSAQLGEKATGHLITLGGIQSATRADLPPLDYILVDECHRLPNNREGQYWSLIAKHPTTLAAGCFAIRLQY